MYLNLLQLYKGPFKEIIFFLKLNKFNYCINTSEIPVELSGVHMISSHMKITCNFTHENNKLF